MRTLRLLMLALACALLPMAGTTALAQTPTGPPLPPIGFKTSLTSPAGVAVQSEMTTLNAADCVRMQAIAQSCQVLHRRWFASHQPLPAGARLPGTTLFAGQVASAGAVPYFYWAWSDQECSGVWPYCVFPGWSLTQTEDGVANNWDHVYQWDHGCTPGGFDSSVTWCGSLHNGGANVGSGCCEMQFGLNGQVCLISQFGTGCFNKGIRRWIWSDGRPGAYQQW